MLETWNSNKHQNCLKDLHSKVVVADCPYLWLGHVIIGYLRANSQRKTETKDSLSTGLNASRMTPQITIFVSMITVFLQHGTYQYTFRSQLYMATSQQYWSSLLAMFDYLRVSIKTTSSWQSLSSTVAARPYFQWRTPLDLLRPAAVQSPFRSF